MSTAAFPTLMGLGWNVKRSPEWSSRVQTAVSGKETRIALWSYPRWHWDLTFDFLRSDAVNAEFQALAGFFNARQGQFDSFLYTDADDNSVMGQAIGTGDGATLAFPMARSFGGFTEPMLAPATVWAVYLGGVAQSVGSWSVSTWGSTTPGILTFVTAPGAGVAIAADFSFAFPCRFEADTLDFEKFMNQIWSGKSVKFISVK